MGEQNKFANEENVFTTLGVTNSWISNIDSKISFMLAFLAVLSGFILNNGLPQAYNSIKSLSSISEISGSQIISAILVTSLYILLFLSIFKFLNALTAKVDGDSSNSNQASIFFFGSIGNKTLTTYTDEYLAITDEEAMKQVLEQVHTNSKICTKKVKDYNDGMRFSKFVTAIWFLCSVFQLL